MAFNDYRDLIRQMEREMQQFSDEAFRGFFGRNRAIARLFVSRSNFQKPVDIVPTRSKYHAVERIHAGPLTGFGADANRSTR